MEPPDWLEAFFHVHDVRKTNARRIKRSCTNHTPAHRLQDRSIESGMGSKTETAVLGGGCFWCVEAALEQLEGVLSVESGYMGGEIDNPSYEQVCTGKTGHAEVVRVEYDPELISYPELLEVFFTAHDPTTLDRQGNDVGTQYRSVIFVLNGQRAEAEKVIAELTAQKVFDAPIVTSIEAARTFWKAEKYHQNYFANNSHQPYCLFAVAPKVAKVRAKYAQRVKRAG
jgi:peptide-methionine (S)-S-oxide reductase